MFRMITAAALPAVEEAERLNIPGAPEEPLSLQHIDTAAKVTRNDYGRWSRWILGLIGTAGLTIAILLSTLSVATALNDSTTQNTAESIIIVGIGAILGLIPAILSGWLLVALHRSGKRLARAAGFWSGYAYRTKQRLPERRDWFTVRFAVFSPDLFLRIITSALAGLVSSFAVSIFVRALATGDDSGFAPSALMIALLYISVGLGQFGGVQRIQNGLLIRDPWALFRKK